MKNNRSRGLIAAMVAAMVLTAVPGAASSLPTPPEGMKYVEGTEHVFLGGGCTGDTPTCDTTGYWIGLEFGDSSPATLTYATPANGVLHLAGEPPEYQPYPADDSLRSEYLVDASRDVTGRIEVRGSRNAQFTTASVAPAVHVRLTGQIGSTFQSMTLETVIERPYATHVDGTNVFEFTLDIPEELDGTAITSLNLDVATRGFHAYTFAFVNAEGGSWFDLPFHDLVEAG